MTLVGQLLPLHSAELKNSLPKGRGCRKLTFSYLKNYLQRFGRAEEKESMRGVLAKLDKREIDFREATARLVTLHRKCVRAWHLRQLGIEDVK